MAGLQYKVIEMHRDADSEALEHTIQTWADQGYEWVQEFEFKGTFCILMRKVD